MAAKRSSRQFASQLEAVECRVLQSQLGAAPTLTTTTTPTPPRPTPQRQLFEIDDYSFDIEQALSIS
jgi:hypothetical protein